jgi:hypothetical protein
VGVVWIAPHTPPPTGGRSEQRRKTIALKIARDRSGAELQERRAQRGFRGFAQPLVRRVVATAEQCRHLGRRERTNPRFERLRRRIDRRAQPCFQTGEDLDLTESHRRK